MFKSKKELAVALMEGRKFETACGVLFYDESSEGSPFRYESHAGCNSPINLAFDTYNSLTEIKEWYQSIPDEGIICWVWDFEERETKRLDVITLYSTHEDYSFIGQHAAWKYAEPVSPDQCYNLDEPYYIEQCKQLLRDGKKVNAIKLMRSETGMDLREAKEAVEALEV